MFISKAEKETIKNFMISLNDRAKDLENEVNGLIDKTAEQDKEIARLQEQIKEMKTVSYKTLQEKEEDKKDWSQIVDEWINGEGK